jgi:hypothetical protein
MTTRSKTLLWLVPMSVLSMGGTCLLSPPQQLDITGHGTVSVTNHSTSEPIGPLSTCAKETCSFTFDSEATSIDIVATPADKWALEGITTVPGSNPTGKAVDVDRKVGWTITVVFKEVHLPDCTPTANPGAAPTLPPFTKPLCVGKSATTPDGTGMGGTGACLAIDGKLASILFGNDSSLTFTVPADAPTGTQPVTLWTLSGSASQNADVKNEPAPEVPTPPTTATVGQPVTLTGTGFTAVDKVTFDAFTSGTSGDATFTIVSDTEMTVTVPAGTPAGQTSIVLKADCGRKEFTVVTSN